jgi:hypothetical protein
MTGEGERERNGEQKKRQIIGWRNRESEGET